MGKKRNRITETDLINGWMVKYHGITVEEAYAKEPWTNSHDFYSRYPVTQQQHDEWREWMIQELIKDSRMSRKFIEKNSALIYLNTSPMVIEDNEGEGNVI